MARRVALLIATYEYEDEGLRRLTAPAHDAEALAAVLRDPGIAGFEVTTLLNEPHHRVGEAIGELYRDRLHNDLTLLYFTGHGLKDEDGRLYLATSDTRRRSLLFTSLPAGQIDQAMSASECRQQVLILDCCYSGAFPASGDRSKGDTSVHTLERFQGRGRTVLTASDATRYAFEGDRLRGDASRSVFTHHLVEGLRDGSADLDGDGDITLDELYTYVHERVVQEQPHQRPKKQDNVEGRLVIARNPNWTLPPYLSNAVSSPLATDRLSAVDGLAHLYRVGNPLVRGRAAAEIRRLADDDSRAVSAAATARLREWEGVRDKGVRPEATAPPPASPPVPPSAVRPARTAKRPLTALPGVLALLASVLLATTSIYDTVRYGNFFWGARASGVAWYGAILALVALLAGACVLRAHTRELTGPGILLGVGALSVWGLAYLLPMELSVVSAWTALAGHLLLLAAASLHVRVLRKGRTVRLEPRRPATAAPAAWIPACVCVAAGLVTVFVFFKLQYAFALYDGYIGYASAAGAARGFLVAAVPVAAVPAWALVVTPGRFAVALLGGWVGGVNAIAAIDYARVGIRFADRAEGLTLAVASLVLGATAMFLGARRTATTPLVRFRRTVLVALLVAVPVLAACGAVLQDRLARSEAKPLAHGPSYSLCQSSPPSSLTNGA
ncbi:caspase domain-containing protein [Streptomyces sp. NPDC048172]|uniref:caspase family protein n=1 Tax=Streptomyces sp. NPDC048172 TaxID=3365505 RepID=UPI003718B1F5